MRVPFVIYADIGHIESIHCNNVDDKNTQTTQQSHKHKPFSIA